MTASATLDRGVRLLVGYDGPAMATGRMDVRTLAPAMASVAQLIDDATRIVHGSDTALLIEVSGDFRRGSFTYQLITTAIADLTPAQIRGILEWLGLIATVSGLSVVGVLKWLGGRKVERVTREGNDARITASGESRVVNLQVAQLVMNYSIRADLEGVTAPLARSGITELRTGEPDEPSSSTVISESEIEAFLAPQPEAEKLHEEASDTVLQLVSPNFRIGNKWQFAYPGEAPFFAPILDGDFLRRLQRREESFSYGDLVRVKLRTTVTRTEAGTLSTTREIQKVYGMIPPPKQTDLFSEPDDENPS